MDSVFSIVYLICFVAVLVTAISNFILFKNSVNMSNIMVVILLLLTLLGKSNTDTYGLLAYSCISSNTLAI